MEILLLGPLELLRAGEPVPLPRRQQRALLAALALHAGEAVSIDRLIEDLWGADAPRSALGSLQNAVSALRKAVGADVLLTQPPGYRLALDPAAVDALRFERLVEEARTAPASERGSLLAAALALWRGSALADLAFEPFAGPVAARLEELRLGAVEERIDADLEQGLHAALVPELESLVAQQPLRERLRSQLMLALYRSGRQAEALEVYRAARLALADELGLDPSPELQELERRVLRQDPSLAPPAEHAAETVTPAFERRLVTALAALPPADEDPERHRLLLDETLKAVQGALERNGGTLERFGPEGVLALFGAEAPRDDDAQRALATARELGLRAGLATGEVVAGAGAVINRAVELAHSEGIALDERTRTLLAARRRMDVPLAGREPELARLRESLAAVRADVRCQVVTVLGEPGIGKTRLARELLVGLADEAEILVARCVAYGEGATFLPLLAALRRAEPERVLADEPDAELVVARLAALGAGGSGSLGESYWAVRRLLETLARRRPVVLVVDDVHWAEPALLDLVDYLGERAAGPLLVLCLARPELERTLGETLTLGPLADEHARLVVRGSAQLDEPTQERIVALAEGNALYAEQLAVYAAEAGEGLPPTLEAVLAGRLGQLDDEERAVLQRAAVVGREFTRGAVAALAENGVDAQLASLGRRGLIRATADVEPGDDAYRFHHVLLRDAAYASLTRRDRADLHERVAAWLDRDGDGDDALAGYHLEQAALCRRALGEAAAPAVAERAGERLGEAAMRAWRQNDTRAAVGLLQRATDLLPGGERRAELLCELAAARFMAGESDHRGVYDEAARDARAADSARVLARIDLERAHSAFLAGATGGADTLVQTLAAIDILESAGDDRALGRAWLAVGEIHAWACRYTDVADAAARASTHYRRASFSPAACTHVLAQALAHGPTPLDRALPECFELREDAGGPAEYANVTAALSWLVAMDGRIGEARDLCAEALAIYEDLGSVRSVTSICNGALLAIERRAGRLAEAATLAARAEDAHRGEPAYASTWAARLAEILYWSGDLDGAGVAVERARRGAVAHDVYVQFLWRSTAAKLAARAGHDADAQQLSAEALRLGAASDAPTLLADLWTAQAEVHRLGGRNREARTAGQRARTILLEKGDRAGLAELEGRLGKRLAGAGTTKSPSGLPA